MPSPVFASYAQADRDKHLERFMREFQETLGAFQGVQAADRQHAFFDRNLRGGEKWEDAILLAVREARVLVCLMSHTYLRRPWCGRELQVFLERDAALQRPAGVSASFIFPIWWLKPLKPRPLPAKLAKLNWRDPRYPDAYLDGGVWGLARGKLWGQFTKMADALAQLVHDALEGAHRLPEGVAVADVEKILNAFDEQQPFDVRLLALTTGGDAWHPGATDGTVAKAAEETARKQELFIRPVDQSTGLAAGLQKAQADRQIILLVLDASLAPTPALATVNGLDLPNLAVLLVETATPALGADGWLAGTGLPMGALAGAKGAGLFRAAGPGALAAEMQLLIEAASSHVRIGAAHEKAADPQLAERARTKDGFDPEAQPHLAGIGGTPPR